MEYRDRLVSLARRVLRNRQDAEETVDECLGRLARPDLAARIENLRAWLHQSVLNLAIDRARAWTREQQRLRHRPEPSAHGARPADEVVRAESREAVWRELLELPRRQQEVLILHEMEEVGYDEIGKLLGIEAATARVHAHAGRLELRRRLAAWRDGKD